MEQRRELAGRDAGAGSVIIGAEGGVGLAECVSTLMGEADGVDVAFSGTRSLGSTRCGKGGRS